MFGHQDNGPAIGRYLGFGGVPPSEKKLILRLGLILNAFNICAAVILLIQWHLLNIHAISAATNHAINLGIWLFFTAKFLIMMLRVQDRLTYAKYNWMSPIVIVMGVLLIFKPYLEQLLMLRPALAIMIFTPLVGHIWYFFIDGRLRTTILATFMIVVFFGLLLSGIESNHINPWQGIWWAIVTFSTVGYGDIVPMTALGKLLGVGLIIMGIGMFAILTANILAFVLEKAVISFRKDEKALREIHAWLEKMMDRQGEMQDQLTALATQVEALSGQTASKSEE